MTAANLARLRTFWFHDVFDGKVADLYLEAGRSDQWSTQVKRPATRPATTHSQIAVDRPIFPGHFERACLQFPFAAHREWERGHHEQHRRHRRDEQGRVHLQRRQVAARLVDLRPHLPGWEVSALHMDPGGRIFLGTTHYVYGATFRVSDDMGQTWNELKGRPTYPESSGRKVKRIWQIMTSPADKNTLLCGVDEAGLFCRRDRGESWNEVKALTSGPDVKDWFPGNGGLCLHTILVDPKNAKRMWVGISAVGMFRTTDGGESWQAINNGLPQMPTGAEGSPVCCCPHKPVLDPTDSNTLYMQFHGGVLRSTDGGDSWHAIENGLPGNFGFPDGHQQEGRDLHLPAAGRRAAVLQGRQASASTNRSNGGESWKPPSKGLPTDRDPQFVSVLRDAMAVDPHDPAGVYVGTTMGDVWASNDAGESWSKLPGNLPRIETVRAYLGVGCDDNLRHSSRAARRFSGGQRTFRSRRRPLRYVRRIARIVFKSAYTRVG